MRPLDFRQPAIRRVIAIAAITIGMLWVAFFAASAAGVPLVTTRSTPAATSSAAISWNLAASPSADLYSM